MSKLTEYRGTLVRTSHRTIYVNSARECTDSELKTWMAYMADNDISDYEPEAGVYITVGGEYHSEQSTQYDEKL